MKEEYEFALIAKTASAKFEAAKEAIRKLHSYEVPCIVALPHAAIDAPYAEWIREETA